jgi:hypothetical protein
MEETAQNFENSVFINRSWIFIALPKFYVTHRIYEILSKPLVPTAQFHFWEYIKWKSDIYIGFSPEAVDMNGRFQMQGGKNWFLPKEMNATRFFCDSHWLEIWSNHFYPSMGPNGVSVAMDSALHLQCGFICTCTFM